MMKKREVRKNCYNGCHGNIVDSKTKQMRAPHQPQAQSHIRQQKLSQPVTFLYQLLIPLA
jgi:hypothetical protein